MRRRASVGRPRRTAAGRVVGGFAAALLAAAVTVALAPTAALADGPTISGAGSTWSQIALDQWRADVARYGLSVNYQGVGSSAGRQFFIINQVDFAASEIPFYPDELAKLRGEHKAFQYLPDVAGGTSLMYNLVDGTGQRVTNLQLSSSTAAGIFTGTITNWDDPKIAADNGGRPFPNQPIIPVIRSDGSGTSAQFSLYLATKEPAAWAAFARKNGIPDASTSYWPNFPGSVAQRGSDGVANFVANDSIGRGAIGYVEAGYAIQRGFPVASMRNASGHYTQPTSANVATALTHATLNADLTQNLGAVYDAPEATAYPVSSYSYLITQTTGFDPAKGNVLGKFILYFACDGQQQASLLGYSPLPPNLVQAVFDAVKRIPGAPAPPPLSQCNNPTIQHGGGGGTPTPTGQPTILPSGSGPAPTPTGSGPAPTASGPTPSAGPSPTGPGTTGGVVAPGATPTATPSPGETLSSDEQAQRVQEAIRTVSTARDHPALPLAVAAIALLAVVFGPLVWQRRSQAPPGQNPPPGRPGRARGPGEPPAG
jgi:phosphate transport system substrate-binding protein